MPAAPYGAKECQSVPQLLKFTYLKPRPMTNRTTATLMTTMVELNRALSLIPTARIAVMTSAKKKAGRLKHISWPKIGGAFKSVCACCSSSGDCTDIMSATLARYGCVPTTRDGSDAEAFWRAITFSAMRRPVQWSYASHRGILRWRTSKISTKLFDHPDETVLAPMAYSSVRSHPMIQANISPIVA